MIAKQDLTGLRTFVNPSLIHFIDVLVTASAVAAWASILLLVAGTRNTWDMVLWFMRKKGPPQQ